MENNENITTLKTKYIEIYNSAKEYINRNSKYIPEAKIIERWEDDNSNFNELPQSEKNVALELDNNLTKIMNRIFMFAKSSPLISEADEHDLRINARKIRSAIYFRKYFYYDKEVIHDEGLVLGVQPARQAERDILGEEAINIINQSFDEINRIINLIDSNDKIPVSYDLFEQKQSVTKIRPNTAFIMMWIDINRPELNDVKDTIKQVFSFFDIKALRADEIEHEDVITKKILDEVSTSEFLIADLTGERPSVYYEIGFAHAIGRRVILYRKKGTNLHFDLAMHNCPEYENLGDLRNKLTRRLETLTNKKPMK